MTEFQTIMKIRLGADWPGLESKIDWVFAEVNDYESLRDAMQGVDVVFHAAAIVSFWSRRRAELYQVNVEGTANVVNAALETGVGMLVHTSSIAALGRDGKRQDIDETSDWVESPLNSHYAISKHLAEMQVWRGREEGLKASMVNPGVILGECDLGKSSGRLLGKILSGPFYYANSTNGYVDVLDVAEAMVRVYEKGIDGERFVLVGENVPAKRVFSLGAALNNKKEPYLAVKPWMLQLAWFASTVLSWINGKEPLITRETKRTGSHHFTYSSEKAGRELGMEFTPVQETLHRVFHSLKK